MSKDTANRPLTGHFKEQSATLADAFALPSSRLHSAIISIPADVSSIITDAAGIIII